MAHKYYDSAATGETTPYESVATAANDLATVLASIGATDEIIWVNGTSSESLTVSTAYTASATYGTPGKPQRLYSVQDFDSSPDTLATGARILLNASSNTSLTLVGNWDIFGVTFEHASTGGSSLFALVLHGTAAEGHQRLSNCTSFVNASTASAIPLRLGTSVTTSQKALSGELLNHTVKFANSGQSIQLGEGYYVLDNLILAGTVSPTTLFTLLGNIINETIIKNSNLTGLSWTNLVNVSTATQVKLKLINCKIPSGANLFTGTFSPHNEIEIINVDSGSTHYRYEKHNYAGSITTDTGIIATTSPLQDDTTSISNKFTASANCGRGAPLWRSYLIPVTDTVTAIKAFAEFLVSGDGAAALNSDEVYITTEYLNSAGAPLGTLLTSHPGLITAGSALSAGTTAYTGDGYTTERTHRIESASFTPAMKGFVRVTVHLTKPSTSIYVGRVGVV